MSNPDGFIIKGKLYPAKSIFTEKVMAAYIEELEEKIERIIDGNIYTFNELTNANKIHIENIEKLKVKLARAKEALIDVWSRNGWSVFSFKSGYSRKYSEAKYKREIEQE